jgi:iron complex transport system ATP-binding protein
MMDGTPLKAWSLKAQAGVRAVVSQQVTLSFPFDVLDVVLMGRLPHLKGRERVRDLAIARTALDQVSARHLGDRSYTTLSGGERQRVDLARALAQLGDASEERNRYLLLDEPTASLDIAHQHEMLRVVRSIAAQNIGVLVVLHDLNLVAQYADEIVLLCRGRHLACGRPEVVLVPDLIQQAFALSVLVTQHPCQDCPLIVPITGTGMPTAQPLPHHATTLSP